jgi:hypothetical protein
MYYKAAHFGQEFRSGVRPENNWRTKEWPMAADETPWVEGLTIGAAVRRTA